MHKMLTFLLLSIFIAPNIAEAQSRILSQDTYQFNEGSSNPHHSKNVDGQTIRSAKSVKKPSGTTAICGDGSYCVSRHHRRACSHHGGVKKWTNK